MKYKVTYKWFDFDAELREEYFTTWKEACRFMKFCLDDGYEVSGVRR